MMIGPASGHRNCPSSITVASISWERRDRSKADGLGEYYWRYLR